MSSPSIRPRGRALELWLPALVVFSVGWSYIHGAWERDGRLTSRTPPGYYGLLTAALIEGHFDLDVPLDPRLLRLENPYAGPQGALRPHDMSYYRGKFYLYYGSTPALILLLPWRLLTRTYLTETAATALFCFGGFLLGAYWLIALRRRVFPQVSPGWTVLSLLLLGFGSPTYLLSNNPTFYAVPISAGFFCLMAATVMVEGSLLSARFDRAVLCLAGSSLALGLAVGSRPDYVLCVGLLVLPTMASWLRFPREGKSAKLIKLTLASVLPAALVGAWLAFYNYRRFGGVFEFGIQYAMTSGDMRGVPMMAKKFLGRDLHAYLVEPAKMIRYYPFFVANGRPFGVLFHLPLAAAAVSFPLTFARRSLRADRAWTCGGWFLLGAALLNLGVLCTFIYADVDRYLVDFVPAALLLACGVLFALVDPTAHWPVFPRRAAIGAALVVGLWTLANGACLGLADRLETPFRARLESLCDRVVDGFERRAGTHQGPLEIKVRFPREATGRRDPLVSTGSTALTGDVVYVLYTDGGHVQFGFFHIGEGGPLGLPVAVDYGTAHTLVVELGSLYPPRRHPFFDSSSDQEVAALRRRLEVTLDGRTVLRADVKVYPSTPDDVRIGENRLASDVSTPRFEGEILGQRRLGLPALSALGAYRGGPVRLHLRWPKSAGANEPLVSTGHNGCGDLLNVQLLAGGFVRFQHDSWGNSEVTSDPIPTDMTAAHDVDVEMGSLYCDPKASVSEFQRRRLAVWLDGKIAIDLVRTFNPSTPQEVVFGYNAMGGSSSSGMFTGEILGQNRIPARPISEEGEQWGPMQMKISCRDGVLGLTEPLLTTGLGYDARIIYVHYEDARHVRFGYDRAGSGGDEGPAVDFDYSRPHIVEITLGSLFPPKDSPPWAAQPPGEAELRHRQMEVRLDGKTVFRSEQTIEAAARGTVTVGHNFVNTNHVLQAFGGQISDVQRLPWPARSAP